MSVFGLEANNRAVSRLRAVARFVRRLCAVLLSVVSCFSLCGGDHPWLKKIALALSSKFISLHIIFQFSQFSSSVDSSRQGWGGKNFH